MWGVYSPDICLKWKYWLYRPEKVQNSGSKKGPLMSPSLGLNIQKLRSQLYFALKCPTMPGAGQKVCGGV